MELQNYDFNVIHRSGSKMQHVDALSRMYLLQTSSILHQFEAAQTTDDHIKTITEMLKLKSYEDYVIHNDLLCRFADSKYQIVVPESMQTNLIQKIHQEGHFKSKKNWKH